LALNRRKIAQKDGWIDERIDMAGEPGTHPDGVSPQAILQLLVIVFFMGTLLRGCLDYRSPAATPRAGTNFATFYPQLPFVHLGFVPTK
jgi:hypothetical protein